MSTLKDKHNPIAKAVRLALLAGASLSALSSPAVFAADEEDDEDAKKIVVTGSRIQRTDIETASPVQVTTAEDISLTGLTRLEDVMNSLPQVEAAQTSFISNGSSGTASLDLRGLGASRTLVLVNGRRMQSGGVYSQSPDINQIPAALVERVEVLTGGASTTYGADAVAGVVNFIMKKDFEGAEVKIGTSGYQHNNDNSYIQNLMDNRNFDYPTGSSGLDGKTYTFDLIVGGAFADGKGHATAYATWRKNDELRQAERDYSSCALNGAGTACGGSGNAIVPNFYISNLDANGAFDWGNFEYWTLDSASDGFIPSVGNVYNYAPVNHFMRPDERNSLGAFVNYEVSDKLKPYLEVNFTRDRSIAQIAESGTFFAEQYNISTDSPLLSATQRQQILTTFGLNPGDDFAVYIGKRNVEGGPRASNTEHNSFRVIAGAEGDIDDNWSYDLSFQYGTSSSSDAYINDFFAPRITQAVGANGETCTGSCIPYEVFTYQGVTPEAAGNLTGVAILIGETHQTIINGYVSGELDAKLPGAQRPIAMVVGTEIRDVKFSRIADEVYEKGLLLGQGGPTPTLKGGFDVSELFLETNIPVMENSAGQSLDLDLGYRYSDYSTSGAESAFKFGVTWVPVDGWKLRTSFNRAVRAPNVSELFFPQNQGLWNGTDPCAGIIANGETPVHSAAQCANSGVTAAQYGNISLSPASQYNGLFGGNPELDPEIADTLTFGIVANPTDNLNFSIDYWNIEMEDVIGTVGAQLTVEQCNLTGDATFCDNVVRGAGGSLWLGTAGYVQGTLINLAGRHWQGIDISANYDMDVAGGNLRLSMFGTMMNKKEYDPIPGLPGVAYDCAGMINVDCFAQPEWRHTLTATYDQGSFWTLSAKWRYFGEVDYDGTTDTLAADGIDAQSYFDIASTFDINENVTAIFGISNLLDEEPPMVGGTLSSNANTVAGYYDTLGRYIHGSVSIKF